MSIACLFGFHDWERHGGEYVAPVLKLPPEVHIRQDGTHLIRPQPTGYISERFEQCSRCDKTKWGWAWSATVRGPPKPVKRQTKLDRFGRPQ
jgi:hypothetical protein